MLTEIESGAGKSLVTEKLSSSKVSWGEAVDEETYEHEATCRDGGSQHHQWRRQKSEERAPTAQQAMPAGPWRRRASSEEPWRRRQDSGRPLPEWRRGTLERRASEETSPEGLRAWRRSRSPDNHSRNSALDTLDYLRNRQSMSYKAPNHRS